MVAELDVFANAPGFENWSGQLGRRSSGIDQVCLSRTGSKDQG